MDPLTHAFFGMACAVAVTRNRAHRGAAAVAGLAAGLLPDADIFLHSDTDPLFNLEYHRHFIHSVFFAPIISLLAAGITLLLYRCFRKKVPFRLLFIPGLVAALGHGFCDVWTSYGTRSWWPFSDARVTLDLIAVIDPLLTLPLLVCVVLALIWKSRRAASVALVWVAFYLALCLVQRTRAESVLQEWLTQKNLPAPERFTVKPSFGNIIVWRVMTVHDHTFHAFAVRCGFGKPQIMEGGSQDLFRTPEEAIAALGVARDSQQARDIVRFDHFSDGWIGRHPDEPNTIGDLRYASMPNDIRPLWGIRLNPADAEARVEMKFFREINRDEWNKFWAFILKGETQISGKQL